MDKRIRFRRALPGERGHRSQRLELVDPETGKTERVALSVDEVLALRDAVNEYAEELEI